MARGKLGLRIEVNQKFLRKEIGRFLILLVLILYSGSIQIDGNSQPNEINLTEKYSKYGFSFRYPKGMEITEEGLIKEYPDNTSGAIFGEYHPNEKDVLFIGISWEKKKPPSSYEEERKLLNANIDDFLEGMMEEGMKIIKKEKGEIKINNKRVIYQEYFLEYPDRKLYGVIGYFYCYKNRKSYGFNLNYSRNNSLILLKEFLRSFDCY